METSMVQKEMPPEQQTTKEGQFETSVVQMENPPAQQSTTEIDKSKNGLPNDRRKLLRRGATRKAGFLFWTNLVAVFSLLVGCFSSGWLTDGNNDYSLWHVTRCDADYWREKELYQNVKLRPCETLSYRLIEAMPVGTVLHANLDYTDFVQAEVLYCLGIVLSFVTLYQWYKFRLKVAKGICLNLNRKLWIFLFCVAAISATVIFVTVDMFHKQYSSFRSFFTGIVFAGFGGALMVLDAVVIFAQAACYTCQNCDICLCLCINEPLYGASENV